jgi:hypothetical protein
MENFGLVCFIGQRCALLVLSQPYCQPFQFPPLLKTHCLLTDKVSDISFNIRV